MQRIIFAQIIHSNLAKLAFSAVHIITLHIEYLCSISGRHEKLNQRRCAESEVTRWHSDASEYQRNYKGVGECKSLCTPEKKGEKQVVRYRWFVWGQPWPEN